MFHKKVWLGLAVTAIFQFGVGELLPGQSTPQSMMVVLAGAFLGGLLAQRNFLFPALASWLVGWGVITYILYSVALPTGHASALFILQFNWVAIIGTAAATAVGAILGQPITRRRPPHATAT